MKLSILIPTVPDRSEMLLGLLNFLTPMMGCNKDDIKSEVWFDDSACSFLVIHCPIADFEIIVANDDKTTTLGEKRELMYQHARGEYSWQLDDDDSIAPDAIEKILAALHTKPDVVTFQEKATMNGREYKSNFSHKYEDWEGDGNSVLADGFHFHRTVFYKCVVKTEIARKVQFKRIRFGEDHEWAKDLKPHIESEIHLDEEIYYYIHNSTPQEHDSRYGIK
jgi:glycosyltransferase involved in cell wall biosynthesis